MRLSYLIRCVRLIFFLGLIPVATMISSTIGVAYNQEARAMVEREIEAKRQRGELVTHSDMLSIETEVAKKVKLVSPSKNEFMSDAYSQAVPFLIVIFLVSAWLMKSEYLDPAAFILTALLMEVGTVPSYPRAALMFLVALIFATSQLVLRRKKNASD